MTIIRILALGVLLTAAVVLRGAGGVVAAAAVWAVCLGVLVRSHPNRLLSLAPLYLLLLGMFHLGLVFPVQLDLVPTEAPDWLRSPHLGTSLWVFTIATAAFTLGARLRPTEAPPAAGEAVLEQPELFWTGLALALAGAALVWVGAYQIGLFSSTYFETYERAITQDFRFYLFGRMVFPIGILVAGAGASRRQMALLGVLFAAVLGPLFFRGVRGPVIVQAASLLALWAVKDRGVARKVAIGVAALAISLVPIIRSVRDVEGASVMRTPLSDVDPVAILLEAGGSMYPLVVTVERVESGAERLWMGRSYAQAAAHVMLNASSRRAAIDTRNLYPNAWATVHADLSLFELGGGIGFSAVAEPYLNFGVPGVVVIFVLLGLFIGACERWLTREPFRAAIGAASFGFILWTVRDDSIQVPRAMMLACATVLGAWILRRVRRAPAPAAAVRA